MPDAVDYLPLRECPACGGYKIAGLVVCFGCWGKMREDTKALLAKEDVFAIGRRKEFYAQLALGTPVEKITLAEDSPNYEREEVKPRAAAPDQASFEFMASVPTRQKRRGRR